MLYVGLSCCLFILERKNRRCRSLAGEVLNYGICICDGTRKLGSYLLVPVNSNNRAKKTWNGRHVMNDEINCRPHTWLSGGYDSVTGPELKLVVALADWRPEGSWLSDCCFLSCNIQNFRGFADLVSLTAELILFCEEVDGCLENYAIRNHDHDRHRYTLYCQ